MDIRKMRNAEITTSSGKNVSSTQMLKGEAKASATMSEKNSTMEDLPSNCPKGSGNMGGRPYHGN